MRLQRADASCLDAASHGERCHAEQGTNHDASHQPVPASGSAMRTRSVATRSASLHTAPCKTLILLLCRCRL